MIADVVDVEELLSRANAALARRDADAALDILRRAERAAPRDVNVRLNIALALRLRGDLPAALAALDAALEIEPYLFIALLSKGAILERMGLIRAAASIYKDALTIAPSPDKTAPGLAQPLARARQVVAENAEALRAFMAGQVDAVRSRHAHAAQRRFDEALDLFAGRKRVYQPQPLLMHFPGLPVVQFFDRELFPWLPRLEAATDMIRDELAALVSTGGMDRFAPYIAYPPGAPVNQWEELNHSRKWSSLWLWRDGARQDEICDLCPGTAALLESLPMADQPGFAPTAVFSALQPRTHIPAHTGSTNARLLTHLPLILPGPARFRVGNDERPWRMGEAWVFDDTIEHEAWNDADETRVILIFDVWNPYLSEAEREMVGAMMAARNAFYAAESGAGPT